MTLSDLFQEIILSTAQPSKICQSVSKAAQSLTSKSLERFNNLAGKLGDVDFSIYKDGVPKQIRVNWPSIANYFMDNGGQEATTADPDNLIDVKDIASGAITQEKVGDVVNMIAESVSQQLQLSDIVSIMSSSSTTSELRSRLQMLKQNAAWSSEYATSILDSIFDQLTGVTDATLPATVANIIANMVNRTSAPAESDFSMASLLTSPEEYSSMSMGRVWINALDLPDINDVKSFLNAAGQSLYNGLKLIAKATQNLYHKSRTIVRQNFTGSHAYGNIDLDGDVDRDLLYQSPFAFAFDAATLISGCYKYSSWYKFFQAIGLNEGTMPGFLEWIISHIGETVEIVIGPMVITYSIYLPSTSATNDGWICKVIVRPKAVSKQIDIIGNTPNRSLELLQNPGYFAATTGYPIPSEPQEDYDRDDRSTGWALQLGISNAFKLVPFYHAMISGQSGSTNYNTSLSIGTPDGEPTGSYTDLVHQEVTAGNIIASFQNEFAATGVGFIGDTTQYPYYIRMDQYSESTDPTERLTNGIKNYFTRLGGRPITVDDLFSEVYYIANPAVVAGDPSVVGNKEASYSPYRYRWLLAAIAGLKWMSMASTDRVQFVPYYWGASVQGTIALQSDEDNQAAFSKVARSIGLGLAITATVVVGLKVRSKVRSSYFSAQARMQQLRANFDGSDSTVKQLKRQNLKANVASKLSGLATNSIDSGVNDLIKLSNTAASAASSVSGDVSALSAQIQSLSEDVQRIIKLIAG